MLDELPFETDDAASPRRHRRSRGGRTAFTLLLVVVLLGTLSVAGFYGFDKVKSFFTAADYEGDGNGETVEVVVNEGDNISVIGNTLYEAKVVKSAQAFIDAAGENPDASGLLPGEYALEKQMSGEAALNRMLSPGSRGTAEINVPDGLTHWAMYETLASSTGLPVTDFEAAGADPKALGVPDEWFEREDGKDSAESIEGFLLPDTYKFKTGASAADMMSEMVARFLAYTEEIDFIGQVKDLEYTMSPYEALIAASLTQGEAAASKPDDLGKVARVVYNRLHDEFACSADLYNCLEFDSSLNYGIMLAGGEYTDSAELTEEQLANEDNEYNTHVYAGLTPTPINNPGKAALEGAVDPPKGNWLFFVAVDKEGNTKFSDTVEEFDVHQMEACNNGVFSCDAEN